MSSKDSSAAHVEDTEHEALLAGAITLASLFSSCVEAFGLIHPSHKWDKEEQLLLTRLGLQQARLLIWGSVLGVASPPASVTDRAIPKNPSSVYPDLNEPTFFDPRDPRLDDTQIRTVIEQTLSAIVDRSSASTRDEMMATYGLKPPKRFSTLTEPALDLNRLEAWREKYELLREVAETYAQINTKRSNSIVYTPWMIADVTKFGHFIKLTQEKVDLLIDSMDIKEKVDRAMRMDIRVLGWHITFDRTRTAQDISKLRLLREICMADYPEYVQATQQALDNINRESRENNVPAAVVRQQQAFLNPEGASTNGATGQPKKRPGLRGIFRSFSKHKDHQTSRAQSASGPSSAEDPGPERSHSDVGPDTSGEPILGRVRSKSIGGYVDSPDIDEDVRYRLERLDTMEPVKQIPQTTGGAPIETIDSPLEAAPPVIPMVPSGDQKEITRHDQYHGIARTATKDLSQPGGNFSSR